MRKQFAAVLAGTAFATLGVLALPGRGQQAEPCERERECSRLQAVLEQRVAELTHLRESRLAELTAQLEAQRATLQAALDGRMADLRARTAEFQGRASEFAEHALAEAPVAGDVEVLLDDDAPGWLGVGIAEVTAEKVKELKLPAERGVLLTEVEAESPAAKAGLKTNDVITEFNGQRIEGTAQFRRLVRETPSGRTVQLTFWRDARSQTVAVQLTSVREQFEHRFQVLRPRDFNFHVEVPAIDLLMSRGPVLGIDAEDLSGQLGSYFGVPDGEGVLVREVRPGTPAEKAGLKAGDVITKVDGERVRTVGDLRAKLQEKREKKTVGLGVIRKGAEMSLNVEIEQPKPVERRRIISRRTAI